MPLDQYDPIFQAAGQEWNVDPTLLKAVAQQESGGQADATSTKGASGVMQIMPDTATGLGVTNRADPEQSIFGGAKYMRQLLDKYGSPEKALMAYNAGPGRVDKVLAGQATLPDETKNYVPAVTANYQRFSGTPSASGDGVDTVMARLRGGQSAPPPSEAGPSDVVRTARPSDDGSDAESNDDFLKRTAGAGAGAGAGTEDNAAFLSRTGKASGSTPQPATADQGGIARNVAAGATDAGASTLNMLINPAGTLGKIPAAALVFGHDALAPVLGYNRFDDATRNLLLGDNVPEPGTSAVNALGAALGVDPSKVAANTDAERIARKATAGAGSMIALGPGSAAGAALLGAGGAVAGDVAGQAVPAWAQPVAEMAGNVLGAGVTAGVAKAGMTASRAGANALEGFAGAPYRVGAAGTGVSDIPTMTVRPVVSEDTPTRVVSDDAPSHDAGPQPGMGGPAPNAAGAQASTAAEAALTPAQVQAYRSTAEGQKLLEPQPAGTSDNNLYVRGSNPNSAEIEQTVQTARELKSLGQTAPAVSQEMKDIAAANNDARSQHFQEVAGSHVDVANMEAARETQLKQDYPAAFKGAKDADAQPVVDAIQETLNDPRGKQNTQLKTYVQPLLNRLVNEDGTLKITDPQELYGFREDVNRMRSKASKADDPNLDHVDGELGDIIDVTDKAIEDAAPGYRKYMDNYAQASRQIDEKQVLMGHEKGLYDSQNRMTYANVQRMMRNIVDSRQSSGLNQYKSITDDTMQKLWALRDDLRRSATARELASTAGSDTSQNLLDALKGAVSGPAGTLATGIAGHALTGPAGGALLSVGKQFIGNVLSGRTARRQTQRGMQLLHPDPATLRNPLAPP